MFQSFFNTDLCINPQYLLHEKLQKITMYKAESGKLYSNILVSFSPVYFSETVKQQTGKRTNPIVLLSGSTVLKLVPKGHSLRKVAPASRQALFLMSRQTDNQHASPVTEVSIDQGRLQQPEQGVLDVQCPTVKLQPTLVQWRSKVLGLCLGYQ